MVLVLASSFAACADRESSVRLFRTESYTFSARERRLIEDIAQSTFAELRSVLADVPANIQLTVRPGADVIEETGETGSAMTPDGIMWTIDPQRLGGVEAVARKWLRASLFHEVHHLVRAASQPANTLIERALQEGMATVFERDFAGADAPWGKYPENVGQWADELRQLPPDASIQQWLYTHPDGRRWIGIKVGSSC